MDETKRETFEAGVPTIYAIVPVHGEPLDLVAANLESIRSQTYAFWTCIIVNTLLEIDISTAIPKDERFIVLESPNSPPGAARNSGLAKVFELSDGRRDCYVVFQDADDLLDCCFFESLAKNVNYHPEVDVLVYGSTRNPSLFRKGRDAEIQFVSDGCSSVLLADYLGTTNPTGLNVCTLPGKAWRVSNLWLAGITFDERLYFGEDVLFCILFYVTSKSCILGERYLAHFVTTREDSLTRVRKPSVEGEANRFSKTIAALSRLPEGLSHQACTRFVLQYVDQIITLASHYRFSYFEMKRWVSKIFHGCSHLTSTLTLRGTETNRGKRLFFWLLKKKCISLSSLLLWIRAKLTRIRRGMAMRSDARPLTHL